MKLDHLKKETYTTCQTCSENLESKNLHQHIFTNHYDYLHCMSCGNIFTNRQKLLKHLRDMHKIFMIKQKTSIKNPPGEPTKWICSICAKQCDCRSNLVRHERTHIIKKPHEYYICDFCGKYIKDRDSLSVHIRRIHINRVRYHCDKCEKHFSKNSYLQWHIKIDHHKILEFKCEYCGKAFGRKYYLYRHRRIHTGEQPYACKFCGKKFTHEIDCYRHSWTHNGKKPVKCRHCSHIFVNEKRLEIHLGRCKKIKRKSN